MKDWGRKDVATSYNNIFVQGCIQASFWSSVHHITSLGKGVDLWDSTQGRHKYWGVR